MVSPIDQGAIIRSGMSLVPDYAAQVQQELLTRLQQQQVQVQQLNAQREFAQATQKQQREQQFRAAVSQLEQNPEPRAIARLMTEFPEFSEGLKRAYDATDADKKQGDMSQLGEAYSYLGNGNVDRAVSVLQRRVDADKAAGREADEEALLESLKSGDPEAVKAAQAQLGMALATLAGPAQFASVYKGFNEDKTTFQREYEYIAKEFGDEAAELFGEGKFDPLVQVTNQSGTTSAPRSYFTGKRPPAKAKPSAPVTASVEAMLPITLQAESGGQRYGPGGGLTTSSKGAKGEMQVMPGTITDPGYGVTPAQNNSADEIARVGRDYLAAMMKRYGNDPAKAWAAYNAGPDRMDKALAGGGDWLKRLPKETRDYVSRNMRALNKAPAEKGPVRVVSRQQYAKLASGTEYVAPDGSTRVKP